VADGAVVRVGYDLHAVADVVELPAGHRGAPESESGEALAVGRAITGRGGVVDPVELPVRDDEVRIGGVLEERRDELLARKDLPVEQELALIGDLVRTAQVRVAETDREQEPAPERSDAHAALAAEPRLHVAL